MVRKGFGLLVVAAVAALVAPSVLAWAQSGQSLGSVRLPRAVTANGERLAAGTYAVRVSDDAVAAVVGQAPEGEKWVEFLQGNQVRGRELATVLTGDAVREVAKGPVPSPGNARVELLKGNDYLRVWINSSGTHYLIHFAISTGQ